MWGVSRDRRQPTPTPSPLTITVYHATRKSEPVNVSQTSPCKRERVSVSQMQKMGKRANLSFVLLR